MLFKLREWRDEYFWKNKTHRRTKTTRGRPVSDVNTKFAAEFTFRCVKKPNKRTYKEQESKVFSSSFFFKALLCKSKEIEPQLTGIKQNSGATKQSKIKIHTSKISLNLDLPHSLVFNVFFSSLNFCVADIKHIKTTENKLDLECILPTRWALFCISPQSPPRKLSILTGISKPCPPFTVVCGETSTVTPDFSPRCLLRTV